MSKGRSRNVKSDLAAAKEKEKSYKWLAAAKLYEQAMDTVGKDEFLRKGEIQEQISYCLYRGAFQVGTQEDFKNRMQEAVKAYEKAAEIYENGRYAKSLHCKAMALYAHSWTLANASRKKEVLDDCRRQLKEAIKALEETGDRLGYGKACNDLLFCLWDRVYLEWDWTETKKWLEEALEHGQSAISTLSKVENERELTRAYIIAGLHSSMAGRGYLGEEKRDEFIQTALSYAEKALELSKKAGDGYLTAWSTLLTSFTSFWFGRNLETSRERIEEGLQQAKRIGDSFLIGFTSLRLAFSIFWLLTTEENPDKMRRGYEKSIRYAGDAVQHLLVVCRHDWLTHAYSWHIEGYYSLAGQVETDSKERRNLLERAIEIGQEGLGYAKQSGVASVLFLHHSLSKALYGLSKVEKRSAGKRRLLEEALEYREKGIASIQSVLPPFEYWNHGVWRNYAALIKAEFTTVEADEEKKRELLGEAVSHMERCIELCTKWTSIRTSPVDFAAVGQYYSWFGGILDQLYSLTREEEILEKAVKVYQDTAETYRKAELPTRAAEAYWHAARLYDQLGEHTKAEHNFQLAAENYKLAAKKIPELKGFYMDHTLYMQAWSEIEKARQHHLEKKYGQAKEHYKKAASLHESTERWAYLSPNYVALAQMDEAEDLSRKEQAREAKTRFERAAKQFLEAKESLEIKLDTIDAQDEKEVTTQLAQAANSRRDYCLGRTVLEEAKILDRQGDHRASARSYGDAAEQFRRVADAMELESDRQELMPLVDLCRAWHMMTRAEAETSPDLYLEAAQLFDEARKHSLGEQAKVLALGHSSFCKALEAGARFEATSDMTLHATAKKHIEAAEKYYLKAGFKTASAYAKATLLLSDAYMYLHTAETEADPTTKTQYYQMAEKVLQASAGSYMQAKHPEKSDQVQRLLEGVKEKRQLAMSLAEVLHAPTITTTTDSFTTPTPTREQAAGLERFEHADVQANLILRGKEVRVGEDIRLAIEMVNAGKAPALLIKVDEVIPEGFEIREVPEMYTFEDSYINLKGKRLNPLKTEDVKVVVKPRSKGTHIIKPRILYIDENGKYKSHEPEPVTITVKELGIRDWIKGE